jgi:hypothetical protein
MKKVFFSFIFMLTIVNYGNTQNLSNIACLDFTLNDSPFERGKYYSNILESIISNIDYPPHVIERNKVSEIVEKIQEEKNLFRDFKTVYEKPLKIAEVDYLVRANFTQESPLANEMSLIIEFIKVAGEGGLQKKVLPRIVVSNKDLSNTSIFEMKVKEILNKTISFAPQLGLIEKGQMATIT